MNEGRKSRLEVIVTSSGRNKNLDEIKNVAGRKEETTRSRKVTILTVLMHSLHNYAKHFETTTGKI